MPTSRKVLPKKTPRAAPQTNMPDAYYKLHGLLDSIRTLAAQEDEVCTLLASVQQQGKLTADVRRDLARLLDALPMHCLEEEISALRVALERRAA